MATISLASMLREAESAAYRIRAEAQGLSAVRADIPNPAPPTPEKPVLEIPTIPTEGAKALEEEKDKISKTQAEIEAEKAAIEAKKQAANGNKVGMNSTVQSGILLSDMIDLADSLIGRSIFEIG